MFCEWEYFIDIENKTVNIVTDAFENAITLKKYIQNLLINPEYIPHKSLLQIMYNLLKPIYHISKLGIAHLDIKPDNILINPDTLDIQIIDFGVSCYKKCKPSGTMAFASPEILRDILKVREISLNESLKSDVFSLGVVFYLLANLQLPYRVKGPNPYKIQESYNIIATTRRIWINPPIVYDDTRPRIQRIIRTTAIISNIRKQKVKVLSIVLPYREQ